MNYISIGLIAFCMIACTSKHSNKKIIGSVERLDPALDALVNVDAKPEVIAEGFVWSEGTLWLKDTKTLVFSDVPKNIVYQWTEEKGLATYLTPSGYTGTIERGGEMGSNGLTLSPDGKLVLCQHGDRRIAMMNAPLDAPQPAFITLADNIEGEKFNSPNDVVYRSNGDIFFTDPPYGLPNGADDTTKETPFNGVYKVSGGKTTLLIDSLTRPNGIAFLPGEKTLIVANSDPEKAVWYAFDLTENDSIVNARILYDATKEIKAGQEGLPDGLRIDKQGNIFATGPGGVWIFDSTGKVLGKIKMYVKTANCAFTEDEKTLFIASHMYIARIRLRD